jgi:hypothetical protein
VGASDRALDNLLPEAHCDGPAAVPSELLEHSTPEHGNGDPADDACTRFRYLGPPRGGLGDTSSLGLYSILTFSCSLEENLRDLRIDTRLRVVLRCKIGSLTIIECDERNDDVQDKGGERLCLYELLKGPRPIVLLQTYICTLVSHDHGVI